MKKINALSLGISLTEFERMSAKERNVWDYISKCFDRKSKKKESEMKARIEGARHG